MRSCHEYWNAKMAMVARAGLKRGMTMLHRMRSSEAPPRARCSRMQFLRKGRYKYVHFHEHEPRLFDLEADPHELHELHDLAGQPEHESQLSSMRLELLGDLDVAALRERIVRSQRERLMILATEPERRTWGYRPVRDPLGLYPPAKRSD